MSALSFFHSEVKGGMLFTDFLFLIHLMKISEGNVEYSYQEKIIFSTGLYDWLKVIRIFTE
jgi:hypothetical protein